MCFLRWEVTDHAEKTIASQCKKAVWRIRVFLRDLILGGSSHVCLPYAAFFGFGAVASGHGDPALADRGGFTGDPSDSGVDRQLHDQLYVQTAQQGIWHLHGFRNGRQEDRHPAFFGKQPDRGGGPGAWHSFGNAFFTVVGGCAAAFVRYALQTAFGLLAAGCGADRSLFFRDASVCGLPQQKMDPAAAAAGTALL